MKKGFLFGGPPSSNKSKSSKQTSNALAQKPQRISPEKKIKEDMPFIKPNGKTESGLTLDEVQQAMSETKGLLANQGNLLIA